jgi:dTDP-4-amino-4,6-dideoxygalactose transaminase
MTTIPMVDLKAQYVSIKSEIDAAIQRVIDNSSFIMGPEVRNFEEAFARFIGVTEAAGVASGTAALHLALLACSVGPGDEVITTPFTFYATAEAITQTGATPVFVDIAPDTYNLDPGQIVAAITPRTKAIVPVHLYGQAADMDEILAVAKAHELWVIEDAAQAHAAEYRGRRCGSIGDIACFTHEGIGVVVHYPIPMHLQPAYRTMNLPRGSFPVTEAAANQVVSLPMFAEITPEQQARVAEVVKGFVD